MGRRDSLALALALAAALVAVVALAWALLPADKPSDEPPAAPPGFVDRKGNRLYLDGRPYRFVGVNLYWANNLRDVGCGPAIDDATLDRALDRLSGSSNAIRAFFFQSQATVNGVRDWTAFDQTLRAVAAHGMKVIVTLANQNGACGDPPAGLQKDRGWYESGYRAVPPGFPQSYRDYVRDVVTRYRNRPEILGWQLTNEANIITPVHGCPDDADAARVLRGWADDVAGLIKSIDPNHLISLGTGLSGSCGIAVTDDPTNNNYRYVHAGPNIDLCEYHDYHLPTEALPGPQVLQMNTCADLHKPFFVGELGIEASYPNRPDLLTAKLDAQFEYPTGPSQGALVWTFGEPPLCDQYCVGSGDPVLDVLGRY